MAYSSIVAVADNNTIEGGGAQFAFAPGDPFPIEQNVALQVRQQYFPPGQPPDRVVPAITEVSLSYGRLTDNQQPPATIPEDHYLRMFDFSAEYVPNSWNASGSTATLQIGLAAALRDNTPSGDNPPDDPFVAFIAVQAICIWTVATAGLLGRLDRLAGGRLLGGAVRNIPH